MFDRHTIGRFLADARVCTTTATIFFLSSVTLGVAQTSAPPRGGGLFGATQPDSALRDRLNLSLEMVEGLDTELPLDLRSEIPGQDLQSGGFSTRAVGAADYVRNSRRIQVASSVLSAFKYYPRLEQVRGVSHSATFGGTLRLPLQGSLQLSQTAAYSPSYLYQLFPGTPLSGDQSELIPVEPDYRIDTLDSYTYTSGMTLAFGSARGTRVTTNGNYRHTDFREQTTSRTDLTTYGGSAKVSHGATRHTAFSLQYEYRAGEFGLEGPTVEHRATVGVEYLRPLSATRRATFRFNATPAVVLLPEAALTKAATASLVATPDGFVPSLNDRRLYQIQSDGAVEYQFRRTWRAKASYRRGMEYLALVNEPVFSDGGRAELAGLFGRRLDFSVVAALAKGESALFRSRRNIDSYTGDVNLRFAISRSFALFSEYLYYYYDLRGQTRLAPELPAIFKQHSVRVGFTLFAQTLRNRR